MFFDLGLRTADYHKPEIVKDAILDIDDKFTVVLIYEYLDESLVLLKRKLCWELDDVLYLKALLTTDISTRKYTASEIESLQKWSRADFLLYEHFNASLWKTISYEKDFFQELETFRSKLTEIEQDCSKYLSVTPDRNFEFRDVESQNMETLNGFSKNIESRNTELRDVLSQNSEPSNAMSQSNIASPEITSRENDQYYEAPHQFVSRKLMSNANVPSRKMESRVTPSQNIVNQSIESREPLLQNINSVEILSRNTKSLNGENTIPRMNQYYCHKMRIPTAGYLEYFRTKFINKRH